MADDEAVTSRVDGSPLTRYQRRSAHLPSLGTAHCTSAVTGLPKPDGGTRKRRTRG
jgi:hypothetical protein